MTANNTSKLTHVYKSLQCIYEARCEDVGKPQGESRDPGLPRWIPGQARNDESAMDQRLPRETGARLVHYSNDYVFDGSGGRAREEAAPTSAYPTPAKRPLNSRLNTPRLQNAFGVTLSHWQKGVARMLKEIL